MDRHMPGLDGLRAIAVGAVLLFHAFPSLLPGGFIGVDIFFVISGYIITKTYFERLRSGQVSLRQFYIKRFRRLAPAYILVLIATTIVAYLLITPIHLSNFSESLAAQPFYLQNFVFWKQGDYFDGALTKPLLHTWSLAVEEQFYIAYGLMILLVRKNSFLSRRLLMALLALLILGSFGANYVISQVSPKTAFFMLPTRIWELALGVMLALNSREIPSALAPFLKWGGLLAIGGALGLHDEGAAFQGGQAALACAGTAAVIIAVSTLHRPDRLLDQPFIAYIGQMSYSLYLWHWPIISIATIYLGKHLTPLQAVAALGLTSVLSVLSFRYIEVPIRTRSDLVSDMRILWGTTVSAALTVTVAILLIMTNGAVYRYPGELAALYTAEQQRSPYRCPVMHRLAHPTSEMCQRNAVNSDNNILIIGDSHADQLDELIAELGANREVGVFLATRNCNLHEFGKDSYCGRDVLEKILSEGKKHKIRNIVSISFFKKRIDYEKPLHDALSKMVLHDQGIERAFIMQVVPNDFYFNPREWINVVEKGAAKPRAYTGGDYVADYGELIRALENIKELDGRIGILDPTPFICTSVNCSFASDGVPNYFDSHHLSPTGARLLTPMFAKAISEITGKDKGFQQVAAPPTGLPAEAKHLSRAGH